MSFYAKGATMFFITLITVLPGQEEAARQIQNFPLTQLVNIRDVNIGGLYEIYSRSPTPAGACGSDLDYFSILKLYSVVYVIDQWNQQLFQPSYNISIGYVMLPTCGNPATALVQSIILNNLRNNMTISGVIGPITSLVTLLVSPFLSFHRIPHISPEANSHQLSNPINSYLFRITSSQKAYLKTMLKLITHFGWNQVSIIYSMDSFYLWFKTQLISAFSELGICVWQEIGLPYGDLKYQPDEDFTDEEFKFLRLISNPNAKVVILLLHTKQNIYALKSIKALNGAPDLLFIGVDSWPSTKDLIKNGVAEIAVGAITFFDFGTEVPDYFRWLHEASNTSEWNKREQGLNTQHPWFAYLSSYLNANHQVTIGDPNISFDKRITLSIEAATVMLHALDAMLKERCSAQITARRSGDKSNDLVRCVENNNLRPFIKNLTVIGLTGPITFGSDNAIAKPIVVGNFRAVAGGLPNQFRIVPVARSYLSPSLSTSFLSRFEGSNNQSTDEPVLIFRERVEWKNYTFKDAKDAPFSSCNRPCGAGEFKITSERVCCWTCHRCNTREIIVTPNISSISPQTAAVPYCESCPLYKWPMNYTSCEPIPIFYLGQVFRYLKYVNVLYVLGVFLTLACVVFHLVHCKAMPYRLELQSLMACKYISLFMGFAALVVITSLKPTLLSCSLAMVLITLGMSLILAIIICRQSMIHTLIRGPLPGNKIKTSTRSTIAFIFVISSLQIILLAIYFANGGSPINKYEVLPNAGVLNNGHDHILPLQVRRSISRPYVEEICAMFPSHYAFLAIQITLYLILVIYILTGYLRIYDEFQGSLNETNNLQNLTLITIILTVIGCALYFYLRGFEAFFGFVIPFICTLFIQLYYVFVPKIRAVYK